MSEFTKIPCCDCGLMIDPSQSYRCMNCLSEQVQDEVKTGIKLQESSGDMIEVVQCNECFRWLHTQNGHWVHHEWESPGLLQMLLKKIGLGKNTMKIIEGKFIFTEPHSRRIIVQATFERSVLEGNLDVRSTCTAHFKQKTRMCEDCVKDKNYFVVNII